MSLSAAAAGAQEPLSQLPVIVTAGDAVQVRAPDQAFVTVSVETRAKNPRDATRQNAEAMTAVQQKIAAAGVPKDAVRTVWYDVQQEFDFTDGRRVPRDFLARNGIEVRIDTIDKVAEVLDVVVQGGATSIAGIRFDLKDRTSVEREALRLAVADARGRAESMAAGAGRTIDRVIKIEEGRPPPASPRPVAVLRAEAQPTPIEPGSIEIRAQVTLTVAIK